VRFDRQRLLRFYDTWDTDERMGSHVSAITGLLGEDLVLALLRAYWEGEGYESEILGYQCKGPGLKGNRLDAWLLRKKRREQILFQTEIKNWAAYSTNEDETPLDSHADDVRAQALAQWGYYFGKRTASVRPLHDVS
jgi:hypothetical protein